MMNYRGAAGGSSNSWRRSSGGGGGGGIHLQHQHPLVQLSVPNLFTCISCKEFGAGRRFSCEICNFEVHEFCATPHQHLNLHPLHPQHQLHLHPATTSSSTTTAAKSSCDVCGMPIKGYSYRCSALNYCTFQLHPTCTLLSTKMEFPSHPLHPLILLPSSSSSSTTNCGECRHSCSSSKKQKMMVYSCTVGDCDYHLHAACAKTMLNGLHAHGIKLTHHAPAAAADADDDHKQKKKKKSNNMLGAAAKIASHVVIGFIGGLVEGIGEGVGEALSQNIINKGTPRRRLTNSTPRPSKYYNPPPPPPPPYHHQ